MRPRWPASLAARILLVEVATILLAGLTLWVVGGTALHRIVDRYQARALREQAAFIAPAIHRAGAGWTVALPAPLRAIYDTPYDGRGYALMDAAGHLLAQSRYGRPAAAAAMPRRAHPAPFRSGTVIGISWPLRMGGTPLWLMVTQDEGGPGTIVDDVAREFLLALGGILLVLLVLLPLTNGFAIRHMVRVIRRVSARASLIGGTQALHHRLDGRALPSEVAPLVDAANGLLQRLETSFHAQAEFSANVAHELRTPLATLKAQLDALDDPPLRDRLDRQVDRLSHILSQLRDLAALEAGQARDLVPVDLADLAVEVVAQESSRPIARGHRLRFRKQRAVTVHGNRLLIELAVRNLIDNAFKHTPPGTAVLVSVSADGSLTVSDEGPGVASLPADLLVQRFWRADHARSDGAGLGLSIVQRIMAVHHGRLDLLPTRSGAAFRLLFEVVD